MIEDQDSDLLQSIHHNMQSKSSNELLAIWNRNDRNEWSDEAFSIIHGILLERLGSVPEQNPEIRKRRRSKKVKEKKATLLPPVLKLALAPAVVLFLLVLLIPIFGAQADSTWLTILIFLSMALFFFLPGFYLGWQSWFQGERVKEQASDNLPRMKKSFYYSLFTYFLPNRSVPTYFLYQMRFMSVVMIGAGVWMILL